MDYILSFTPRFLLESAFDFVVLSIESDENIGSELPWQQLPKKKKKTNCICSLIVLLLACDQNLNYICYHDKVLHVYIKTF